jgi:hypothetical protein
MKWIPKIISLLLLWGAVASTIIYIDPELLKDILIPGSYLPFLILLTITIWYTLAIFIRSAWKSLVLTLTLMLAIILSILQIMYTGLFIVILLTLATQSWYIYHSHEKIHATHEQKNRGTGL